VQAAKKCSSGDLLENVRRARLRGFRRGCVVKSIVIKGAAALGVKAFCKVGTHLRRDSRLVRLRRSSGSAVVESETQRIGPLVVIKGAAALGGECALQK
jgi:hypothetical protein